MVAANIIAALALGLRDAFAKYKATVNKSLLSEMHIEKNH